ncbi:MAG TPA: hypothetical protein VJ965_09745 [Anaerolineales bacterium]|nr:hypothetical protein [Anaerolineales bacterium]
MDMGPLAVKRKLVWGLLTAVVVVLFVGGQSVSARPLSADYDCTAQTGVAVDECEALVALYNATGGSSWSNATGWLQSSDVCTWHGVGCSDGHVIALDLFNNNLSGSLPIEIGGFPYLRTLTLNDNPLSGPIPVTITFLDLDLFHFQGTTLCEPVDPAFQDWFSQIVYRFSSGIYCSTIVPTNTPSAAQTQTAAAAVENLPWPQQTLTALAVEAESTPQFSTATLEPSPTLIENAYTATPMIIGDSDQVIGSFGGMEESSTKAGQPAQNQRTGFLSNIPTTWLMLLMVPLALIVMGIYLELRERRQETSLDAGPSLTERFGFGGSKDDKKKEKAKDDDDDKGDSFGDFDMYDFGGN